MKKIGYIASFDGLRGIAVFLLMCVHGSYGYLGGGIPRVDLFYIMSGFLITYLLFNEYNSTGTIAIKQFFGRRALRIIPALLVCLVISNLVWPYTEVHVKDQVIPTLSSLFFFNNLIEDHVLGNMNHLWSLSVEEHFYLIWPAVTLFILVKLSNERRVAFLFALLVAVEIFRIIAFQHADEWRWGIFWIDPYGFTLCRIDCILIGALMFFVLYTEKYNYGSLKSGRYDNLIMIVLAVIVMVAALSVKLVDPRWLNGGFMISNILCATLVILAIRNPNHPVLASKYLVWIGKRSYGIYLYHMSIFLFLENFRVHHSYSNLFLITFLRFAISIALAALSYQYIERPILESRKKARSLAPTSSTPSC